MHDLLQRLESLDVETRRIDFARIESEEESLRGLVLKSGRDFLLFSENEQVLNRKRIGPTIRNLRAGYSSFSGIDEAVWEAQTRRCLEDYLAGTARLDLPPGKRIEPSSGGGKGGLSLVFDTEQLGGVRFGLPRILDVLEEFNAPATFFLTGFVASVYPDLVPALSRRGHSIGIHGACHEYLSDMSMPAQVERLRSQRALLGTHAPVEGANFFARMNADSVRAMAASGLRYFLVSMEHIFRPFRYRWMPVGPLPFWTPEGSLWMVPVSVETYNRPSRVAALASDAALSRGRVEKAPAITLLMHPFRDGSLRHLDGFRKLLEGLFRKRRLAPVTVDATVSRLGAIRPSIFIHVSIGEGEMNVSPPGTAKNQLGTGTYSFPLYWQMIGNLFLALRQLGESPALCLGLPDDGRVFAVYPHAPQSLDGVAPPVSLDPLALGSDDNVHLDTLRRCLEDRNRRFFLLHPDRTAGIRKGFFPLQIPRSRFDLEGMLPELLIRLAGRMAGGRILF